MKCPNCGILINPKRTLPQSRMFHAICGAYARVNGMGAEHVKILWKYLHSEWVVYPFRGPPPEWPGKFVEMFPGTTDHKIVYLRSEASLTKAGEKQLIDGAISECYDAGVDISKILEGAET